MAQVLIETAARIATATRAIVAEARAVDPCVTIAGTRKTIPGAKAVAIEPFLATQI